MVNQNGENLRINLRREVDDSYDIIGKKEALSQLREDVESKKYGSKVAVIASPDYKLPFDVKELRGSDVIVYETIEKTPRQALTIMGDMSKNKFGRDSVVLSAGNNDIAGFVAAYFNRGVNLITLNDGSYINTSFNISSIGSSYPKLTAKKIPKRVYDVEGRENKHVELKKTVDDSYDIVFANDIFEDLANEVEKAESRNFRYSRYAIITDSNIRSHYHHENLEEMIKTKGAEAKTFYFEAGEPNKTFATCERILEEMQQAGYLGFPMIALGGGVVGDMAGFKAEMMGVPIFQIPTSVMAQADSSVGGKTAVDTPYGKNLMGAFRQPVWVGIGSYLLTTLPIREFKSGMAETIKHGVILDDLFLDYIDENISLILNKEPYILRQLARNNCFIKGTVVEEDPHEKGPRRQLNYGHTLGHAIEKISVDMFQKGLADDYLLHGEAVAIGMALAGDIATNYGFPKEHLKIQNDLLQKLDLPIKVPEYMRNEDIIKITSTDKKAKNGKARYTLPLRLGEMNPFEGAYVTYVDNDIVMAALNRAR